MKLGQYTKSRSLIIMNTIPSVYEIIITGYENRKKLKFTVKHLPVCLNSLKSTAEFIFEGFLTLLRHRSRFLERYRSYRGMGEERERETEVTCKVPLTFTPNRPRHGRQSGDIKGPTAACEIETYDYTYCVLQSDKPFSEQNLGYR